jgi:hypothetical protein
MDGIASGPESDAVVIRDMERGMMPGSIKRHEELWRDQRRGQDSEQAGRCLRVVSMNPY